MSYVYGLLSIALGLVLVVGLHEAGHALAARLFRVRIKRIAIGFGKPLWAKKSSGGIEWVWALWPLGGYVLLLNTRHHPVKPEDIPFCFDKKPVWQRIIILAAGAFANIVIAAGAFFIIHSVGFKSTMPVIADVKPNTIAAQAGLHKAERLLSISGQAVNSWREVSMTVMKNLGNKQVKITVVNREGEQKTTDLNLSRWDYNKNSNTVFKFIGIKPDLDKHHQSQIPGKSLQESLCLAMTQLYQLTTFYLILIKHLITGILPITVLLGPIGLFSEMIASFAHGLLVFVFFIGNLSLAVAVLNLLPIPGLDGGLIMYTLYEKIRGKPVSVAMELLLYRLALIAFFVFLIQLLMNDLQRYLQS